MFNKQRITRSVIISFVLSFILSFVLLQNTSALTCSDIAPQYSDFENEQEACLDKYEQCVADPFIYDTTGCETKCNAEYPSRINQLQAEGCYQLKGDYYNNIINNYQKEYSVNSATKLADWCQCLQECRASNAQPKDIAKSCEAPLLICCKKISRSINPNYSPSKLPTEVDEQEEKYFVINEIKGYGYVEIVRAGESFDEGIKASNGMKVYEGDHVFTDWKSSAVLVRHDNDYLLLEDETHIVINSYTLNNSLTEIQIKLFAGKMTTKVVPEIDRKAKWEIKAPTMTVGVRGTIFSVSHNEETGISKTYAHEHSVYVISDFSGETIELSEGEYVEVDDMGEYKVDKIPESMMLTAEELVSINEVPSYQSTGMNKTIFTISSICIGFFILAETILIIVFIKRKTKTGIIITAVFLLISICALITVTIMSLSLTYSVPNSTPEITTTPEIDIVYDDNDNNDDSNDSAVSNLTNEYFTFNAGSITEDLTQRQSGVNSYSYCYASDDAYTSDYNNCNSGEIELFTINIMGEIEYQEYTEFEGMVDYEILGESENQLYFIVEFSNGMLPEELLPFVQYRDSIINSFELL